MREEDQGQEAAYACRYAGPDAPRYRARRRRPGRDGGVMLMATLFVGRICSCRNCLRRWWLSGTRVPQQLGKAVCLTSKLKSCGAPIRPKHSSYCPSAGSLNAPSPGSTVVEDLPRTGEPQSQGPRFLAPRLNPHHACAKSSVVPARRSRTDSKRATAIFLVRCRRGRRSNPTAAAPPIRNQVAAKNRPGLGNFCKPIHDWPRHSGPGIGIVAVCLSALFPGHFALYQPLADTPYKDSDSRSCPLSPDGWPPVYREAVC